MAVSPEELRVCRECRLSHMLLDQSVPCGTPLWHCTTDCSNNHPNAPFAGQASAARGRGGRGRGRGRAASHGRTGSTGRSTPPAQLPTASKGKAGSSGRTPQRQRTASVTPGPQLVSPGRLNQTEGSEARVGLSWCILLRQPSPQPCLPGWTSWGAQTKLLHMKQWSSCPQTTCC